MESYDYVFIIKRASFVVNLCKQNGFGFMAVLNGGEKFLLLENIWDEKLKKCSAMLFNNMERCNYFKF